MEFSRSRNNLFYILLELIFALILFCVYISDVNAASVGDVKTFSYTGSYQMYEVPATGDYKIETWGAQGGYSLCNNSARCTLGGKGGYAGGTIHLQKGTILYIYVGGQGTNARYKQHSPGGWNGGGLGTWDGSDDETSGGGGGATDVRLIGGNWDNAASLRSRIMVAGGGGGASWKYSTGTGGGLSGTDSTSSKGATQTTGYAFGIGRDGWGSADSDGTGGGGGGYWGGQTNNCSGCSSGAGGSGYISGHTGAVAIISADSTSPRLNEAGIACANGTGDNLCSIHYSGNYFTSTSLIAGNASMPIKSGSGTMTGNEGDGYAKITIMYLNYSIPRLSSLSIDKGSFDVSFDPENFVYNVNLNSEISDVNISAVASHELSTVVGDGKFVVQKGNTSANIVVTADSGDTAIYTINFTRNASSYKYLSDITVDGVSISGFEPTKLTYDVNLRDDQEIIDLVGVYGRPSQVITGDGEMEIGFGTTTVEIYVVSEDGNTITTYTLHFKKASSSRLKSLTIAEANLNEEFDSETFTYSVGIPNSIMSLKVIAVPFDETATVKITGNSYIKNGQNGLVTITVTNASADPSVSTYTVRALREGVAEQTVYNYSCTGEYQTFKAPMSGMYQIELWGAQGGYSRTQGRVGPAGGAGGYTSGEIYLNKDQELYVYVGCKGADAVVGKTSAGGWNGGGLGTWDNSDDEASGGGGGATDIRLVPTSTKTKWNEFDSLKSRIMVAGGGGGSSWYTSGGAGGGFSGLTNRARSVVGTQTSGYAFGIGQDAWGVGSSDGVGGGGSGYYGGRTDSTADGMQAGAGGSSFISGNENSNAISEASTFGNIIHTNQGDHYSGLVFKNSITINGTQSMPSTSSGYMVGNKGGGYARITKIKDPSENNFLSLLSVKATNYDTDAKTEKAYTPTFDMAEEDYYVTFDKMETIATIAARPEDSTATIEGLGEYDILAGETIVEIKVTAESGKVKTYKVHITRPADDNPYPYDITISGLVPSLCSATPVDAGITYCDNNAIRFNKDTSTYYLTVPSRIKQLWFNVEKGHPYQEVDGEGKVSLKGGENSFTVSVTSEDGNNHSYYNYIVVRDMTGNTDLDPLNILEPVRDIGYDPDITEYYFSLPNNYVTYKNLDSNEVDESLTNTVQFYTKTDDPNASYIVMGPKDGEDNPILNVGMNQINILVTAANGETKTYVLNVYRMQNENVFLKKLEVSKDSTVYEMVPEFNQIKTGDYKVTVPNDVTSVLITAEPEENTTTVEGAGTKELHTGDNKFIIKTTAENHEIKEEYTLIITREKNNDAFLSELHVKDGENELLPELTFNKETMEYEITVSEGLSSVNITALPEVTTTTYKLLENATIRVGQNRKRVMTIAEDGTSLTYTVNIIRPASTDNTLKSLDVYKDDQTFELTPEFDPDETDYTLEVENEVNYVNVLGVRNNNLATISGNGRYNLAVGENLVSLTIKSEDGTVKKYNVVITRKPNSNPYLSNIRLSAGTLDPEFIKTSPDYTIEVDSNTHSIEITGIPEYTTTTVTGNNSYNLNTGNNYVTLTTLAEDGIATMTYNLTIVKEESSNNYLSNLILKEGALSPSFTKENDEYTAVIPYSKTKANFIVTLDDERSTYEIINDDNLVVGENEVIVKVTAQNGDEKEYKVTITRLDEETSRNTSLLSLTTDVGTLTPVFNPETMYYEVELPHSDKNITVSAKQLVSYSTVTGTGTYSLDVGDNLIIVKVTSIEGNTRDYQIVVRRAQNNEARLSSVVIANATLDPMFDKDTFVYTTTTNDVTLDFTSIVPIDADATYQVLGNDLKTLGLHEVIIRVTAANGVDTKDYSIEVTKLASNNNNLSRLEVEGYEITPTYVPTTTVYRLTVDSEINSINIIAESYDPNAVITGDGMQVVEVGINNFTVEVTSESGKVKSYTIIVTKGGSSNNRLDKLEVLNGLMNKEYTNEESSYNVEIEYDEEQLDLDIILASESATYTVSGNSNLPVGNSKVYVNVTAEDGSVRVITLNVTRKEAVSALLKKLDVTNYELSPTFNRYVNNYNLLVDNEVEELTLDIETVDPHATYVVSGNENFVVGNNTVAILVTASDGVTQETYTLNVNRQAYSNTFLDYLYTSEGDVIPNFNKMTLNYSIDVGTDVEVIELIGEAVDKSTTVTGLGEHSLVKGENKIPVVVTATSGIKRTYYVTVNRARDNNNYLASLEAKNGSTKYTISPDFNKTYDEDEGTYIINVPVGTTSITLTGTPELDTSIVTGLGEKTLHAGDNDFDIVVTSESGSERIYKVKVVRPASDNNFLTNLIPSLGELDPVFTYTETDYILNLDSSASVLSFEYNTEDMYATVSGTESQIVLDGTSTREIIVKAEDGSERKYTITINKERTDNAKLKELSITGFEFDEEFDPEVFEYHVTVPRTKNALLKSEVIAIPEDNNAVVNKGNNITLSTTSDNLYTIIVTAPDGFTKETYTIHVEREKNNDSSLLSLVVNVGELTTTFNPSTLEYTWVIPKNVILNTNSVTVTTNDSNASVIKTDYLKYTNGEENIYEVMVVSEDGSNSTTYKLKLELDLSTDATLASLEVDKGYYEPVFDPEKYEYVVYEYEDTESITVTAIPNNETSSVTKGNGEVNLTNDVTPHEIEVTAEDGTKEIYNLVIYKTIKRDETLDDLFLNGLEDLECINDKCILSPSFNSNVVSYSIKVPFEYETLDVYYQKKNEQQTVKVKVGDEYVDNYQLPVGKTTVMVEVYDGMNKLTKTYELEVERCKSNNTYLRQLQIKNGDGYYELDPEFVKTIQEYTINVDKEVTDLALEDFIAIPEYEGSGVYINNYTYLQEGNNDAEILVTAPDGSQREYIVHIIRASEYNSNLKNITVSTGVFWELSPKFKPTTYEYTVVIPGQYSKATVEGVAIDSTMTTVSGTGEYELVTGSNLVTVTGTSLGNGQTSVYTINIIKEPNTDVDLISLIVEEGDVNPIFDRSTTKYSVTAPEDADSLTIHATPSSREATVMITGNNNLHSGKNIINIIVQNKDKTMSKTYQLTVNKERSSNNRLEYIKVFDDDNEYELDPEFNENINYYKVEIPENILKVTTDAKTSDVNAIITGLGEEYLDYGDNLKNIIVTAENGNVNTYYVNLYRQYNLNLKLLESDKGELDPEFDPSVTEYVIELDKDQKDITFVAKAESNKVTVSGSGIYYLIPGDNPISFVVKDPDGNEKTYSVNVKRAKDDNNYIKELSVEGILTPVFEKTVEEYTLDVHKEVKSLDLTYTLESSVATSEVTGNNNFVFGEENIVTIKVTAENGDEREYVFKVTPRPDEFFSNRLLDLTVSSGQLTPDFNPDINYYAVTVPNSTSELTITTLKENEYAAVSIGGVAGGVRNVNLNVGRNVFPVVVTSQDGESSNTYNVVIYRSQNNDATLQSLIVTGHDYHPIFNKTTTSYTLEVGSEVNELDIEAIPTDANAKVEISGYKNLIAGENIVTIKVTAPDNETTMRYQIKVNKSLSKNNYISSLSVSGYTFDKTYVKTDQGPYTINVESGVNSIMINAIPEVDTTTITGDGKVTINKGRNVLSVVAASESGDERTYTIIVNRAYSTDSTLKNILVSDGDLDPEFNPETLEYEVEVEEEVEEITINGILNDAAANVTGNGTYDLTDGDIEVPLVVTAEDGITKTTYKVKVHRIIAASSYLKSLVVRNGELYSNFHKLITSYTILVPNEVRSLDMTYLPEDELATVEVTGNESFKVGTNRVKIIVTAKDNSSTTIYEIAVVRQSKSSNYLQTLTVNDYILTPAFDKTVMYYEVTVGTDVDTVDIFAEAEDPTATVDATDLGLKTVNPGTNRFYVTVESASGAIRTYQVVVNKTLSSENKLLTLTSDVGEWDKEFDSEETSYIITVPIGTKKITLEGTASPTSTINGLGTSDVKVGDNTRTIVVTGQDGSVNTYTLTIKRPSNANVNLTKLIPSVGMLSPSYDNEETNYTITVPDNANVISFEAETEDPNATVTGTDLTNVDYGDNEITIVVTGEDGETKKTIKVTVSRGKALESILVDPTSVLIEVGESKDISYTLNPGDTTYTGVEWVSEDETVATVSNGKITGVKNGSTVVKVVSTHDNTIYATVTVNVISKRITSSVYEIYRFTEEEKNETVDSEEEKKVDYTVGAEPETMIQDFVKNFDNNEITLHVFDRYDFEISDKEMIVGTGMKIKLIINDVVYDTLEIAVKGDLDGDGIVAMPDYASLKNRLLETEEYTFIKAKASDFDNDDILAMSDYNTLKNYLLGLSETLNKPRD